MILIIDNYDSFTYNLYQMAGAINPDVKAVKNDVLSVGEIEALAPSHIIISPGPGRPSDAGVCDALIERMAGKVPILGVCLGHQAICEVFGAEIGYARVLVHGKRSMVQIANGSPIFKGLPPIIEAGRYHSLAAVRGTMPDDLLIIAEDDAGEVMGVKHRAYEVYGVQFHPESILTRDGYKILENFLKISAPSGKGGGAA
ncbi:MAG: aminodeoxychorismate/anthranilate synthase component II [Clostridiales Family XIII bacterium]|jgi:anthranilate synthase component 2|nr:aminodeoxychorismate/anthranilate synthase component II [Clostridiales Family XIII bacterium]